MRLTVRLNNQHESLNPKEFQVDNPDNLWYERKNLLYIHVVNSDSHQAYRRQ